MTRKDFELIAQAVKQARDELLDAPAAEDGVDAVAQHLADALAGTNPRFDRDRFVKACG